MYYFVYLIENENRNRYIGFTSNIKQRISDHNSGKGTQTTKRSQKWKLIYFEGYLDKRDALGREVFLKSGAGDRFLKKQLRNFLAL